MKVIDLMKDNRSNCYSVMIRIKVEDYLNIISESYEKAGNIEGQRVPISSKTGKRIRDIMIDDIKKGTILPPIVLGCVTNSETVVNIGEYKENFEELDINKIINGKSLSIIDGMQRTTALMEVIEGGEVNINSIRIEIWITDKPNNLIYRMLVLNTGQISWSLKKQLEVVFSHVEDLMIKSIPGIKLFDSNESKRSTGPGEYQLSHMVELYLAFTTRKENVDLSKEVTERFAKLDIVDLSSNFNHLEYFVSIIERLVSLDRILNKETIEKRILGDQHARVAFIVSISKEIFGKTSIIRERDKVALEYSKIIEAIDKFIVKLKDFTDSELIDFCDLDVFEEITLNMGKLQLIDFYKSSFDDLVKCKFNIESLQECWRA